MEPLLQVDRLCLGRGQRRRLEHVDLQLAHGERVGLLGINGAGKSSLLAVLAGVLAPTAGTVALLGRRLDRDLAARRSIGYLPQQVPAYRELSVRENLAWAGRLRGLSGTDLDAAVDTALAAVQLDRLAGRLAGRLSAGMLQRLGLGQALIHRPALLLLDEPTAGLDPVQTEHMRELLAALPHTTTLLLASHLLDDVQYLCQRVIVLDGGRKTGDHPVVADSDLRHHFRRIDHPTAAGEVG